jgi:hypothetical protein
MHSSVREANFQALLSDDSEMRSHVSDLVEVYEAFRTEDVRGTRLAHMVDAAHVTQPQPDLVYDETRLRESRLPDSALAPFIQFLNCKYDVTAGSSNLNSLAHTIISPEASFLDSFSLRGVQYSTKSYRTRNSHILFRSFQGNASMAPGRSMPGQITHIFLHSLPPFLHSRAAQGSSRRLAVYVCVQPYGSLQPELSDTDQTYRKFGFAGGFLCRRELAPVVVIEPSNIVSHVAVTPLCIKAHPLLHILPMDRVCL